MIEYTIFVLLDAGYAVSAVPWSQEERALRPISIHAGWVR